MTAEEILKVIKENEYEFFGIRGWNEQYQIGEVLPESGEWDYE